MNTIKVIVRPNASKNEILGYDETRAGYKVNVKAPAEGGKANNELIRFLSKEMGKKMQLVKGKTSREKVLRLID